MKVKKPSKIKVSEHPIFPISINVHNLMMVPEDVPEVGHVILNQNGDKCCYWGNNNWTSSGEDEDFEVYPPKLWYEIPEFDLKPTKEDFEEMSKEQLIKMILKEQK